ncbi:MAG TPA: FTR1 family protein [Microthrixaceae bacterium]|jgi:high-affinity iron transporter|nr:FTR1 family protein [Microthrixaceae bacterium]HQF94465.1 FTR1 family protein [Microthrixaceae bacterium]
MTAFAASDRARRFGVAALLAGALLTLLTLLGGGSAGASSTTAASPAAVTQGDATRETALDELHKVRDSIDETLALLKAGKRDEALAVARSGYLDHFELVEIPLRAAAPELTLTAEEKFAEIRSSIKVEASTDEIRTQIIELRGLVDDAERQLTAKGLGAPSLAFGQAFLIMFREGLEAVLLLSALLGYLEATKNTQYRKHIIGGVGLAVVATVATFFAVDAVFAVLPFGREVLEAVVALVAVAMLFYVSFWLIARLEQRRWMEFLRAKVWTAVSVGSATSLTLIGFTSVYREGFETALFFQALNSFGTGLGGYIAAGAVAGVVALAVVAFLIFKLGRKLPIRVFMSVAVVLIMATSVAFLGNAIRALQEADKIGFTALSGWPRLQIFLAQATGYYPTAQGVIAQGALTAVYLLGALYMFVIRPRRSQARPAATDSGDHTVVELPDVTGSEPALAN